MQINQLSVVVPVRNESGHVASLIGEIDVPTLGIIVYKKTLKKSFNTYIKTET